MGHCAGDGLAPGLAPGSCWPISTTCGRRRQLPRRGSLFDRLEAGRRKRPGSGPGLRVRKRGLPPVDAPGFTDIRPSRVLRDNHSPCIRRAGTQTNRRCARPAKNGKAMRNWRTTSHRDLRSGVEDRQLPVFEAKFSTWHRIAFNSSGRNPQNRVFARHPTGCPRRNGHRRVKATGTRRDLTRTMKMLSDAEHRHPPVLLQ